MAVHRNIMSARCREGQAPRGLTRAGVVGPYSQDDRSSRPPHPSRPPRLPRDPVHRRVRARPRPGRRGAARGAAGGRGCLPGLRRVPRNGEGAGRGIPDGIAGVGTRPLPGRGAPESRAGRGVCGRRPRSHLRRVGGVRAGRRVPGAPARRRGLGARKPSRDQRELDRCPGVHAVAVRGDRAFVPAAERSGVGVRRARGNVDGAPLGPHRHGCLPLREWRLRRAALRRRAREHGAGGVLQTERLRSLRPPGQRLGVDPGLLERGLRGRAGRRQGVGVGGLFRAGGARGFLVPRDPGTCARPTGCAVPSSIGA